jgi:hypothetical protein
MAVTTINDIVSGLANDQRINILKNITAPKGAGAFQSSWLATGYPGAGSASPAYTAGSGYTANKDTAGAMRLTNGAIKLWLAQLSMSLSLVGTLIIYDRLWSCSGMGFAASTYAVTTPGSLPARITDSGIGCELWVENFIAAGAASGTLTANYLNTLAQAKQGIIAAVVSAPVVGQMQPVPLAVGDLGISQLTSIVTSATWTSGSFGMTILKRIAAIEITTANIGRVLDWALLGLPDILNDACIAFLYQANAATATVMQGQLRIIDK